MNLLISGASRGLGYEMTAEALRRGHTVIAGVRRQGASNGKLVELADKHGVRLIVADLDVTDEACIAALASQLKDEGRELGAIVNNAAILTARNTPIEKLDMDEVIKSFDTNLYGPLRVVKHFLQLLTEHDASVINISSEAGSISNAYPDDYPYSISKTALNMFSQQLQVYVKNRGIQVLSIHPGWMKTDMGGENAPSDPREAASGILDLIERKVMPKTRFQFVDHTGKEMPI
ncbi:NAD(P)-dependent dehydrogenase, short-chain alcohol dehydrogenase family [Bacillus sp. OV166]|uniref:SDR family oxidoreductase n=1 Tax=Bacillus sp. OV166 TaxID=1882763 RepID=UPI000A2AD5DC|nr:SDR family oxidoreductase [Bacillus sp. OV166]SMQ78494.1 NAD(P)-dependent dehydrogenase, short-chain alcohol dehydrogenase family [Bacillus sp. OV166]